MSKTKILIRTEQVAKPAPKNDVERALMYGDVRKTMTQKVERVFRVKATDALYGELDVACRNVQQYLRNNTEERSHKNRKVYHPDAGFDHKVYKGLKDKREEIKRRINAIKLANYQVRVDAGETNLTKPKLVSFGKEWIHKPGKFVDITDVNSERKRRYGDKMREENREEQMESRIAGKSKSINKRTMVSNKALRFAMATSLPASVHGFGIGGLSSFFCVTFAFLLVALIVVVFVCSFCDNILDILRVLPRYFGIRQRTSPPLLTNPSVGGNPPGAPGTGTARTLRVRRNRKRALERLRSTLVAATAVSHTAANTAPPPGSADFHQVGNPSLIDELENEVNTFIQSSAYCPSLVDSDIPHVRPCVPLLPHRVRRFFNCQLNGVNGEATNSDDVLRELLVFIVVSMCFFYIFKMLNAYRVNYADFVQQFLGFLVAHLTVMWILTKTLRDFLYDEWWVHYAPRRLFFSLAFAFAITSTIVLSHIYMIYWFFMLYSELRFYVHFCAHYIASQLNGANGECTGKDDVNGNDERKRRHKEAKNRLHRKSRGGCANGPPADTEVDLEHVADVFDRDSSHDDGSTVSSVPPPPDIREEYVFLRGTNVHPLFRYVRFWFYILNQIDYNVSNFNFLLATVVLVFSGIFRRYLLNLRMTPYNDNENEFDQGILWRPLYDTSVVRAFHGHNSTYVPDLGYQFYARVEVNHDLVAVLRRRFIGAQPSTYLFSHCLQELSNSTFDEARNASHYFVNQLEFLYRHSREIGCTNVAPQFPVK